MTSSRAQHIRSLFPQDEQRYYSPSSSHYHQNSYGHYYSGFDDDDSDYLQEVPQYVDPQQLKQLEYELRRKNPDILDKLKFAMTDKQYGTLLKLIGKGAFYGAAMYGMPILAVPFGLSLFAKSRAKQISRRNMNIKPRYQFIHGIRDTDTY